MEEQPNRNYCAECNVTTYNLNAWNAHLSGQRHIRHMRTLKNNQKFVKNDQHQDNLGIIVTGSNQPMDQHVLTNYFQKFGPVSSINIGSTHTTVYFSNPAIRDQVLQSRHIINGNEVFLEKEKSPSSNPSAQSEDSQDFMLQVNNLISTLQPNLEAEYMKYHAVCKDLYNALIQIYPNCSIYPFGSTISGLCFNNSDIDVFVGNVHMDSKCKALYRARAALSRSKLFGNCIVIPQAKIPILKTIHLPTGTNIDMNCKSMLGVCNSEMIKYYLSLDETKVKPLMMIIKYWAKRHELSGSNHLFTNYSLYLMIIFYLQQPPYNFPCVHQLQNFPDVVDLHERWNGAIAQIPYDKSQLNVGVKKLLKGFFEFYAKFPYNTVVICPFLGKNVLKVDFMSVETLSDKFFRYKEEVGKFPQRALKYDSTICLQDPLELNRNCLKVISPLVLEKFVEYCLFASELLSGGDENILNKLFTTCPVDTTEKKLVQAEFTITRNSVSEFQSGVNKEELDDGTDEIWFHTVVDFTKTILKDVLLIEIEEITDQGPPPAKKVKTEEVYTSNIKDKMIYVCTANYDTWSNRRFAENKLDEKGPSELMAIDKQKKVTDLMDRPLRQLKIKFNVIFNYKTDPCSVIIQINKANREPKLKWFRSMSRFIVYTVPSWFSIHEKELNKKWSKSQADKNNVVIEVT